MAKILLIDDNDPFIAAFKEVMGYANLWHTVIKEVGPGLKAIQQHAFDLVVIKQQAMQTAAATFLRAVKRMNAKTACLIISNVIIRDIPKSNFLISPISKEILTDRIFQLLLKGKEIE